MDAAQNQAPQSDAATARPADDAACHDHTPPGIPVPPLPPGMTERRWEIIGAAFAVLLEKGWAGTSMLAIAKRAGASKETLYNWFGSKEGLFQEMVRSQADPFLEWLERGLTDPALPVAICLERFAAGLLTLLTRPHVVAVNRAAIASVGTTPPAAGPPCGMEGAALSPSGLAALLLANGRDRCMPVLSALLQARAEQGELAPLDAADAAAVLLGLTLRDTQIVLLLGSGPAPDGAEIEARARLASRQFMQLYGVGAALNHDVEAAGEGAQPRVYP